MLAELHLGATYDAVVRRRLWRHRRVDVLLIPPVILVLTYVFSLGGQTVLLTSIAMYPPFGTGAAESRSGAFLPARDGWAGVADA